MYGNSQGLDGNGKPSLILQAANELAKKFGGKTGTVKLSTGEQPALFITPEMRSKILDEGMTLFSLDYMDSKDVEYLTGIPSEKLDSHLEMLNTDFGVVKGNILNREASKLLSSIDNMVQHSRGLSFLKVFGNMNAQDKYRAIKTKLLGLMSTMERRLVRDVVPVLNELNPVQRALVFHYFTTVGYDINEIGGLTEHQKKVLAYSKDAINTLGRNLVEEGQLKRETFEANEGQYLHTVYMEYIEEYRRGYGNKQSMGSYLKKKKDKTEVDRILMGQIKDVRFLVPETLGIMARDSLLMNMFNNISRISNSKRLFWVLPQTKVKYNDQNITVEDANEKIIFWKTQVDAKNGEINAIKAGKDYLTGRDAVISEEDKNDFIKLRENEILIFTNNINDLEAKIESSLRSGLEDAYKDSVTKKLWIPDETISVSKDMENFKLENYKLMPNRSYNGELRNKWVRKEIYNDLNTYTQAYNLEDMDTFQKMFAQGGTLERINRYWKLAKVAGSPSGWVRNLMGNFVLLDISRPTNKLKLVGMIADEWIKVGKKQPSKYWNLGIERGLFGSTMSANELQNILAGETLNLQNAKKQYERRTHTSLDNALLFADERILAMLKMVAGKATTLSADLFAGLEGTFKVVAMKDYIERWEQQSGMSIDSPSLSPEQREAVILRAVDDAHESIFNYSEVHQPIRTLRRVPFGAPFITFTYKALPATLRAMVLHPVKFAEYAALPALLTMVAMSANNWTDKDVKRLKKSLPDYFRTQIGTAFLPWKDDLGRAEVISLDPMLPWSVWSNTAYRVYDMYRQDMGVSPVTTTAKVPFKVARDFGLLGGPTPAMISALMANKNYFTGQDIMKEGQPADQQVKEMMWYTFDLMTPTFISSNGAANRLYEGVFDPEVNRFGEVKYTGGQNIGAALGFGSTSVRAEQGLLNRRKGFLKQINDLRKERSRIVHDFNEQDKISKLKDIAIRTKLIRERMASELSV
jgi:hypothetical protein